MTTNRGQANPSATNELSRQQTAAPATVRADTPAEAESHSRAAVWLWLSTASALLAMAGSVVGIIDIEGIYGQETPDLVNQAVAQDVVNLAVVAPSILALAWLARRGSLRAYLLWLGALAFTSYNYVIYAFSLHFGPLFLVWVSVLGTSLFALIGGLVAAHPAAVRARFARAPTTLLGWFLIAAAVLFTGTWLKDIVPALLAGEAPQSARDVALPTNPVHVLDLAFFLPAVFATGALLLRQRAFAYTTAPGLTVFLAFTTLPAMATPFVAQARGDSPAWGVLGPMGLLTVLCAVILHHYLRAGNGAGGPPCVRPAHERQTVPLAIEPIERRPNPPSR